MEEYDDVINKQIKELECVKCGTRENLKRHNVSKDFDIKRRSHSVSYKSVSKSVPLCSNCQKEFFNYLSVKQTNICMGMCCVPALALAVGGFIFGLLSDPWPGFWIVIAVPAIFGVFGIIWRISIYFRENKISNQDRYISITQTGVVWIKPEGTRKWIRYEDWRDSVLEKRSSALK